MCSPPMTEYVTLCSFRIFTPGEWNILLDMCFSFCQSKRCWIYGIRMRGYENDELAVDRANYFSFPTPIFGRCCLYVSPGAGGLWYQCCLLPHSFSHPASWTESWCSDQKSVENRLLSFPALKLTKLLSQVTYICCVPTNMEIVSLGAYLHPQSISEIDIKKRDKLTGSVVSNIWNPGVLLIH